ncbi:GH25 family lysozyme [Paenarthrobacter sp.]|uniref:GH25 family lysozyme n=1 Tax=Paenarthrobacter sp. TaxID=1931993 RepID=UPI002810CD10|nr:GH25 family lysozyme [Paenarthrobacter sp.]
MKRNLSQSRHLAMQSLGIGLLAASLIAGPGLAAAYGVEPSPAPTGSLAAETPPGDPGTPPSSPAPDPEPVQSSEPAPATPSAEASQSMAEAVGVGGAEMGQRSARVTASNNSGDPQRAETLSTEGTWMPTFGVQGLDVSGHQPSVDWQHQWNMGGRFAYIKATEGNYYKNPSYSSQYQGSRSVGMIRGAYHFAIPNWSSGADQARYFVANGGGWSADGYTMPPVLDFEFNPYEGRTINGFYFGNTCYNMSPAQLQAWVHDFGNTMQALTGRLPVIYTNTNWWNQCLGNPAGFGNYPLWVAAYPNSPTNNAGPVPTGSWSSYSIWQYSSTGPFAGDSNVWNGDYASLKAFATGSPPPAPTDPSRKLVSPGDFDGDGKADLIKRERDGSLWFYAGDGTGKFGTGRKIGDFGWDAFDRVLGVGDFNGDGKNDLLARKIEGSLWFYAGTGTVSASSTGYAAGVKVGDFGWEAFNSILGVGDFDGDRKPDLLTRLANGDLYLYSGTATGKPGPVRKIDFGWQVFNQIFPIRDFDGDGTNDLAGRKPDGTLWLYSNSGSAVLKNGRQIGTGWDIYDSIIGTGDANGDGMADFVANDPAGAVYFYAGTAMKDLGYEAPRKIGNFGWEAFDALVGTQDFNGDGVADLLARKPDGTLWFYPGTGTGTYGASRRVGDFGWETFNALIGVGDFSGDGKPDLMARGKDGTLWLYPGTGTVNSTSNGYSAPIRIGDFGWNVFTALTGVGDYNGDGRNDVLGRMGDGSLWLYAGTGRVDASNTGYRGAVRVGEFGWDIFDRIIGPGDVNGDGKADLLARKPDGTMWLYAGNGSGYPGSSRRISTEWMGFDAITAAYNLTADAIPDLVARRSDGSLWSFHGTGMRPTEGYLGRSFAVGF